MTTSPPAHDLGEPQDVLLPLLFCPACDGYVGCRPACPACGTVVDRTWVAARSPAVACEHDLPFCAAPLLAPGRERTLVIFGYGRRGEASGGLLALDAATGAVHWQQALGAAVTGGAALAPDGATLLVGDDAGRLHACRVADGQPLWADPVTFAGAIGAPPLLPSRRNEPLATVATEKGELAQVDWRTGRVVRRFDLAHTLGAAGGVRVTGAPVWWGEQVLVPALESRRGGGGALLVCTATGSLEVLATTPAGIYTTPVLLPGGRTVVVGTNAGELLAIDLRAGAVAWRYDAGQRVRAAPALAGATLYVGAGARRLCAVDAASGAERWVLPWAHSINMTPTATAGLVIFADSAGACVAVDAATQAEVWRFVAEEDRSGQATGMPTAAVLGGFVVHGDTLWCGAANGRVYRLALHGGNWAWCEQRARAHGRWLDVAAAIVFGHQPQAEHRAAHLLAEQGEHAAAARLYHAMGERIEAAQAYERAAQASRLPIDWHHAANLWLELRQPQRAEACQLHAAEAGNKPLLHLAVEGVSPLKHGQQGQLRLCLTNSRPVKARRVRVELHGADFAPSAPVDCPELAAHLPITCEFTLRPTCAGAVKLTVAVVYEDDYGNVQPRREWQEVLHVAGADQPPVQVNVARLFTGPAHVVDAQGDIGLVRFPGQTAVSGYGMAWQRITQDGHTKHSR